MNSVNVLLLLCGLCLLAAVAFGFAAVVHSGTSAGASPKIKMGRATVDGGYVLAFVDGEHLYVDFFYDGGGVDVFRERLTWRHPDAGASK